VFVRDNRLLTADVVVLSVAAARDQRPGTLDRQYRRAAVGQAIVVGRRRVLVRAAHRHHQQAAIFPVAGRARRS